MMIKNEQRVYKNMATENGIYTIVPSVLCTTSIVPNNLHRTSNLLHFHTALYSPTQKAVILNTCHIVSKFLTKR